MGNICLYIAMKAKWFWGRLCSVPNAGWSPIDALVKSLILIEVQHGLLIGGHHYLLPHFSINIAF